MSRDARVGHLSLSVSRESAVVLIRAEGEVDLSNADQLAASLRAVQPDDRVVVDLLGVPFMDSSGLKVMLVAADELGDRLALVLSPGSPITSLIGIGGVSDRFSIYPTPAAAIAELA